MFPNVSPLTTVNDIYSPNVRSAMANQAAAQSTHNLDWMRQKQARPGMSLSGGIGQLAIAPWMKSQSDAASNWLGSLMQTGAANAQNRLAGQVGRWNESLGYMQPQLQMYGTDIQSHLANLNALTNFLFNSRPLWG